MKIHFVVVFMQLALICTKKKLLVGEGNNKCLMKRLYPESSELEVMSDAVRDLQSERLPIWPEYRG